MTPPQGSSPRPKSISPEERSAKQAETQRRLKREAAERRLQAEQRATQRPKRPAGQARPRG